MISEAGNVPVIATGGLADGQDVAEVIALGANAAMLGTRFVASSESNAHESYKAALVAARAEATVLTHCFDGGWPRAPHRVLRNETLRRWEAGGRPPPGARPGERDVLAREASGAPVLRYADSAPTSGMQGDVLACCLYSGSGVERIAAVRPAEELVMELSSQALDRLSSHKSGCMP